MDRASRQVVALYLGHRGCGHRGCGHRGRGHRSAAGALGLWQALPEAYRQRAVFHTDDWEADKHPDSSGSTPPQQAEKAPRGVRTNHVERFFYTLPQRAVRLVRKGLCFSKKLQRHQNAIWFFVTHYNLSLQV